MLLIDTLKGCIVDDTELKLQICNSRPFAKWIEEHMITMSDIKDWTLRSGRYKKHILDALVSLSYVVCHARSTHVGVRIHPRATYHVDPANGTLIL
jgi:hypothetical protein